MSEREKEIESDRWNVRERKKELARKRDRKN